MDSLKEAFSKVKNDISELRQELDLLKLNIEGLNNSLFEVREAINGLKDSPTHPPVPPTHTYVLPTHDSNTPTHHSNNPTHFLPFKPLKDQNILSSTGNEGVPTDKQTNQQTHQQTHLSVKNSQDPILDAANILDSLDSLKKEIRVKFKKLTEGELLVFSTLYQLEEQEGFAEYRALSQKLNLTESSIRDYIGRLISKGIPVEKKKINNKNIQLTISPSLKKIASLQTILKLVEV